MNNRTSARKIEAQERRRKAVELRRAGASYAHIAATLDMAPSSVHKTVCKALAQLKDDIADQATLLQAQEADRLDHLQVKLWARAAGGDLAAIDRVLRLMERRARLLGLDAPQRIAPTTPDGSAAWDAGAMTPAERAARIAELERKRRGDDADPE